MTALIIIVAIVTGIAAYLATGALLAVRAMPGVWERARTQWTHDDIARDSVVMVSVITLLVWPLFVPARALWQGAAQIVDTRDPKALRDRLADRERRIAELERELGIGRNR